ncbi:cellular tumor antigen p53-like [Exaiptasia diaphana]|uniref:p53 DNA-binding domain-containing protein n=1 Tax=Exaiptasia diaphana TaxID=2652724 RepID=A0A913WTX1_EXADI|nr:cellular tumor antigen p53-like [Exaiptasia diaphana]
MSVKIPFKTNVGASIHEEVTVHELFSFICNNSCGGLNRRAILVVFTLETGESQELLGRCAIEVRVCACPGRDSKQDNEAVSKPSRKKRKIAADGVSSSTPVTSFPSTEVSPSQPVRPSVEDNTVYNLKVCGYVNYLILRKIAYALEFFANMKSRFSSLPDDPEFPDLFGEGFNDNQELECDSCENNGPYARPIPQASPVMTSQQSLPSCAVNRSSGEIETWYQSNPQDVAGATQSTPYMGCYTYRRITLSVEYFDKDD